MKRIFIYKCILIICYIGLCWSCHNEREKFDKCIKDISKECNLENLHYIVVIPSQGCGGCITYAEEFFNKNKEKKNIFYVFTNIISIKMLQQKVDLKLRNVHLDKNNYFLQAYPPDKKLYPAVLKIEKGHVTNVYYQSPEENGFSKISEI